MKYDKGIFTLIELLMRKSCKSGISFRRQQGRAERCQSPDLTSPFPAPLLNCSDVRLFSRSFFLPCSLFEILTSQGENKDFHPDRAPHRDCNHRDSGGNAPAGIESSQRKSKKRTVHFQFETDWHNVRILFQ